MEYRMYNFVLKSLSTMQKGIQALHSTVEYIDYYYDDKCSGYYELKQWIERDKTAIILDAGNSDDMKDIISNCEKMGIKYAAFQEQDLNNITTSISILVPSFIYELDDDRFEKGKYGMYYNHIYLYELIKSKHLAR